jgi:hypothetical protein
MLLVVLYNAAAVPTRMLSRLSVLQVFPFAAIIP